MNVSCCHSFFIWMSEVSPCLSAGFQQQWHSINVLCIFHVHIPFPATSFFSLPVCPLWKSRSNKNNEAKVLNSCVFVVFHSAGVKVRFCNLPWPDAVKGFSLTIERVHCLSLCLLALKTRLNEFWKNKWHFLLLIQGCSKATKLVMA